MFDLRRKTITQTFRFDTRIHDVLVDEAERQRVSLNTLVGRVLEDYVVHDRYAERAKCIVAGPPVIAAILDELSEEAIRKIGTTLGQSHPREMLAALDLPFTLENVVRLFEYYNCKHTAWCEPTEIRKEADVWTIHLRHGLNKKWSLFLCEYVTAMFQTFKFHEIEPGNVGIYSTTVRMRPPMS